MSQCLKNMAGLMSTAASTSIRLWSDGMCWISFPTSHFATENPRVQTKSRWDYVSVQSDLPHSTWVTHLWVPWLRRILVLSCCPRLLAGLGVLFKATWDIVPFFSFFFFKLMFVQDSLTVKQLKITPFIVVTQRVTVQPGATQTAVVKLPCVHTRLPPFSFLLLYILRYT